MTFGEVVGVLFLLWLAVTAGLLVRYLQLEQPSRLMKVWAAGQIITLVVLLALSAKAG